MNFFMCFGIIAKICCVEAGLMLPALVIAAFKGETRSIIAFAVTIAIIIVASVPFLRKKNKGGFQSRDGLVTVGLAWVFLSIFGAMPFFFSGAIPNYLNALFETISGFTTTGATVLLSVEELPMSILYWRAFTHWLGGMGILSFALIFGTLTKKHSGESMHLMRAESPGIKFTKIVPRMKDSVTILYLIYFVLTAIMALLLKLAGCTWFESVATALSTAGTGGFSVWDDSLASQTGLVQWIVALFMFLFSLNFNIYFLMLLRRFKEAFHNEELWVFCLLVICATFIFTVCIIPECSGMGEAVRTAFFTVNSVLSTSGFATTTVSKWPYFAKNLIIILFFVGGCSGSTAGGMKMIRFLVLAKGARKNIRTMVHPHAVSHVYLDGEVLDDESVQGVFSYTAIFLALFAICVLCLSLESLDFETAFSVSATCMNNVGLSVDTFSSENGFGAFSAFSKIVLCVGMLIGRLELYPVLVLFSKKSWKD